MPGPTCFLSGGGDGLAGVVVREQLSGLFKECGRRVGDKVDAVPKEVVHACRVGLGRHRGSGRHALQHAEGQAAEQVFIQHDARPREDIRHAGRAHAFRHTDGIASPQGCDDVQALHPLRRKSAHKGNGVLLARRLAKGRFRHAHREPDRPQTFPGQGGDGGKLIHEEIVKDLAEFADPVFIEGRINAVRDQPMPALAQSRWQVRVAPEFDQDKIRIGARRVHLFVKRPIPGERDGKDPVPELLQPFPQKGTLIYDVHVFPERREPLLPDQRLRVGTSVSVISSRPAWTSASRVRTRCPRWKRRPWCRPISS